MAELTDRSSFTVTQLLPAYHLKMGAPLIMKYFYPFVLLLFFAPWVYGQSEPAGPSGEEAESVFATALILTDTESATLGFMAFDPDLFPQVDGEEYGSEESLEHRRNIRVFTFPWRWDLFEGDNSDRVGDWRGHIKARLAYLDVRQDVLLGEQDPTRNSYRDVVYGGYLENGWTYSLTDRWKVMGAMGVHLLRYQNGFRQSDVESPGENLSGLLFDTHATAAVAQIQPRLTYTRKDSDLPWGFQSAFSYYLGRTLNGDSPRIRPETWSWSNGFSLHWDLPELLNTSNQLRLSARRIEVGGAVTDSLGTKSYYQFGIGWLFDTENRWSWLDNIGISVAFNVGSALSGGSLVLMYNETDSLY